MSIHVILSKYLSLPKFEVEISHKTFSGKSSSYATGPRPNACHAAMEAADDTTRASPANAQRHLDSARHPGAARETLLLREPLPCNTAATIALQPLIWCFSS